MQVLRPRSLAEALELRARHPDALPLAGGTDVMVELNFGRLRPAGILDLAAVPELRERGPLDGRVRVGAGVTYTELLDLAGSLPGLALAARTVGSPQIRNRGTIGGNLGSASPAGDCHPPLLACGAEVELHSLRGVRRVAAEAFFAGPKRSVLARDELIVAAHVPAAGGTQQFAKVGTRNAMVIAVCSFALSLEPAAGRVGTGVGSAGPTPLRAREAEAFLAGVLDEARAWERGTLPETAAQRFGQLVAAAAQPIDDVRGTAAYRRHALAVLARRTLQWALRELADGRRAAKSLSRGAMHGVGVDGLAGAGRQGGDRAPGAVPTEDAASVRPAASSAVEPASKPALSLVVNGEACSLEGLWEGESLLYVLRERLGLPGSKNACEQGECGSCSVYLDGVLVCSCLVLAAQAEGSRVVTVEGLAEDGALHPVQEAFLEAGAVQCGFCTPGLVVATHDLLARNPRPGEAEIREALAGNLCRCTGYEKIMDAVRLAASRLA